MSDTKCTERLTRDIAAVLLIDHQVGLYSGIVDIPLVELKHDVVAPTKAAQVLGMPNVATTTATDCRWGADDPASLRHLRRNRRRHLLPEQT